MTRHHRPIIAITCIFFCALCVLRGKAFSAELPEVIRVVTYNIHHAEGTDGRVDLERIAKVIMAESPDVVAVNEVDQGTRRTHRIDMPAELARLTDMQAIFEKNIDHDGGRYGNAVLTRLPVRGHTNHKLPSNYEGEQRGLLEVELGDKEGEPSILFFATHFDYRPDDTERLASVKKVAEILADRKDKLAILAGDLNATPDSQVIANLSENWQRTNAKVLATFPAAKPERQIDYVFVRPANRWKVVETRVLDESVASDHRGVLAVVQRLDP